MLKLDFSPNDKCLPINFPFCNAKLDFSAKDKELLQLKNEFFLVNLLFTTSWRQTAHQKPIAFYRGFKSHGFQITYLFSQNGNNKIENFEFFFQSQVLSFMNYSQVLLQTAYARKFVFTLEHKAYGSVPKWWDRSFSLWDRSHSNQ